MHAGSDSRTFACVGFVYHEANLRVLIHALTDNIARVIAASIINDDDFE